MVRQITCFLILLSAFSFADDIDQPRHSRVSALTLTTETASDLWIGLWEDDPSGTTKRGFRSVVFQDILDQGWFSFEISDGINPDVPVVPGDTLTITSASIAIPVTAGAGPAVTFDLDLGIQFVSVDDLTTITYQDNGNRLISGGIGPTFGMIGGAVDMGVTAANTITWTANLLSGAGAPGANPPDDTVTAAYVDETAAELWVWEPGTAQWMQIRSGPDSEIGFLGFDDESGSAEVPTNGRFNLANFQAPVDPTIVTNSWAIAFDTPSSSLWSAAAVAYTEGDLVSHNGLYYNCYVGHSSAGSTEPGVGVNWTTVWDQVMTIGGGGTFIQTRFPDNWQYMVVFLTTTDTFGKTSTSLRLVQRPYLTKNVLWVSEGGDDDVAENAYQLLYSGGRMWSPSQPFGSATAASLAGTILDTVHITPGEYTGESLIGAGATAPTSWIIEDARIEGTSNAPLFYFDQEGTSAQIVGIGEAVLENPVAPGGGADGDYTIEADAVSLTLKNLTLNGGNDEATGFYRLNTVLQNDIAGNPITTGIQCIFENCVFEHSVVTRAYQKVSAKDCDFRGGYKVIPYLLNAIHDDSLFTELNFEECSFSGQVRANTATESMVGCFVFSGQSSGTTYTPIDTYSVFQNCNFDVRGDDFHVFLCYQWVYDAHVFFHGKNHIYVSQAEGYRTPWANGTVYQIGDSVEHNGVNYYCYVGHTADHLGTPGVDSGLGDNEPGVGTDAPTVWEAEQINNAFYHYSGNTIRNKLNVEMDSATSINHDPTGDTHWPNVVITTNGGAHDFDIDTVRRR